MTRPSPFDEVLAWCRENASVVAASLRDGARPDDIDELDRTLGYQLDPTAREFFETFNGEADYMIGEHATSPLLPIGYLFSLDKIVAVRKELGLAHHGTAHGTAGEEAEEFSDGFLPIAGIDSDYLYIDMRPGLRRGCIGYWNGEDFETSGALWPDLATMFSDLLAALRTGEPIMNRRIVIEPSGAIEWVHTYWDEA